MQLHKEVVLGIRPAGCTVGPMGRLLAVPAVVLALAVAASSGKSQKGQSSTKTQSDKAGKKASSGDTGVPECRRSSFRCGSGEKLVPKEGFVPMSYGCLEMPQLDKCCVERDVCMRTCGMPAKTCFKSYVACSKGVCGKDDTCRQNAKTLGKSTGGKDDKELCKTYAQGQQMACDCASQYVWKSQLNSRLVDFYRKHQPDRLDAKGGLLNADRVWEKWAGNESAMFLALTMKYGFQISSHGAGYGRYWPCSTSVKVCSRAFRNALRALRNAPRRPRRPRHTPEPPDLRIFRFIHTRRFAPSWLRLVLACQRAWAAVRRSTALRGDSAGNVGSLSLSLSVEQARSGAPRSPVRGTNSARRGVNSAGCGIRTHPLGRWAELRVGRVGCGPDVIAS
ncbi:unnamed protein product [Prorocentrum cordatum]|uniref:VDE lipocalin domain-containing protein n=1 Tax=Prorocentrum cordatum TaxID=2364126 RepID=A0ABN9S8B9_9DINO|nr:unnamed protein product [Polarella glacialis]